MELPAAAMVAASWSNKQYCVSLQEIYVPDWVEYIAHKAFDEDIVKKISVPSHLVHVIKGNFGEPIHTEETVSRTTLFY